MIGIKAITSYIPADLISNSDRKEKFAMEDSFISNKLGFQSVARKSDQEETSDLCVAAFKKLQDTASIDPSKIEALIVITQNPDGFGLPHSSAIVHAKLGLPSTVAAFDISLGCSGYVYGLNAIIGFMQLNNMSSGVLFTADPYSKVLNTEDRNTEPLFGDAATCTWIGPDPKLSLLGTEFSTLGSASAAIAVGEDRLLQMNGADVFRTVALNVPQQITHLLKRHNLETSQVPLFAFHQGSRFIVETLRKSLNLQADQAPFIAQTTGNTVSSSIPLILEPILSNPPKLAVISGFGVGMSWASSILKGHD